MKRLTSFVALAAILVVAGAAEAGGSHGGVAFYIGGPIWWGGAPYAYPYPGFYPYPAYYTYPGYYPYPVYAPPAPVYIQRPPAVVRYAPPSPPTPRLERYSLSAQELFAFDSYELLTPQPKLDEIANVLVSHPHQQGKDRRLHGSNRIR